MEINETAEVGTTFGSFYKEEDESSWNGHKTKIGEGKTNDLSSIFEKNTKAIHLKQSMKPLMSCTRGGHFESEIGYNEKDGAYGKVKVTWDFDTKTKSDSDKESENKTSKDTGEVNSTDRDDH